MLGSAYSDAMSQRSPRNCSARFGRCSRRVAAPAGLGTRGAGAVRADCLAFAVTMAARRIVTPM